MEALAADTARSGTALRSCGAAMQSWKPSMPCSPRSSSGSGAPSAEQAARLSELQRIRADLQFQEDSLFALERDLRDREARVAELTRLLEAQKSAGEALKAKLNDALFAFGTGVSRLKSGTERSTCGSPPSSCLPRAAPRSTWTGDALIGSPAPSKETGFETWWRATDDVGFNSPTSPKNNWELSVLRSTAVVEVLTANSGLDPAQLTAAGRSEFHPRDPEDRNRNRRISSSARNSTGCTTCWKSDQLIGSRNEPCAMLMPPVPSEPMRLPPKVPTTMPPASGRM